MGGLASLGPVIGDDSGDRSGSVGMGTFGQDMTRGRAGVSKVHDRSELLEISMLICRDKGVIPLAKSLLLKAKAEHRR